MGKKAGLWYKVRLLVNLGVLLGISLLNSLGRGARRLFLYFTGRLKPASRETGLLVNTYELMRERLRESIKEMEEKTRQLEETGEQLRRSRDFLQSIIDSLDEELMVLDSELFITDVNRNFRLKYRDKDIIGRHCYEVMYGLKSPCRPPLRDCPASQVWQTGTPLRFLQLQGADGESTDKGKYFEKTLSPLYDRRGNIIRVVELSRDVTESKELERRILEANRYLLAMNAIAATASQSLSLDVILNGVLDKVLELMDAEVGGILLTDGKSPGASYRILRGLDGQSAAGMASLELARKAAAQGEALVIDSAAPESIESLKAFISVPLKSKERVVGVLNIASRTPRVFSQQEVQLLTSLGHQLGIAVENAQLYQELQSKEQMREQLLRRIISAQEDERQRVARELHDVTSQALATLGVGLEVIATPQSDARERGVQMEGIKSLLSATSKDVHRLIYDLRPSLLDDLGLSAAIRSYAHNSLDAAGVEVHVEAAGQEKRLPPEVEIALFRIIQEAIANIARHARAESAYISLEFKEKSIAVEIEDDGIGFDHSQGFTSGAGGQGVGLLGMQERAELLGGTLVIDTRPGGGTRVSVEVPVKFEVDDGRDKSADS
jgi:signal transduction histidine kinase/PAS domain-containing protein